MKRTVVLFSLGCLAWSPAALADDFEAGSLIIPMDQDYQDLGMFEAYGLVYELLRNGVPVRWVIKPGKAHDEIGRSTGLNDGIVHQLDGVVRAVGCTRMCVKDDGVPGGDH